MPSFALILLLPWAVALVITPLVIRFAKAHGILDHPTARKAHQQPIPLLGGVAVLVSASVGMALAVPFIEPLREGFDGWGSMLGLGGGAVALAALGLYDDLYDVSALPKLAVQVLVAAATWWIGFRIGAVQLPLGFVVADATLVSLLLTVLWIVLVTNAFNLIDGMDGLTTGVGVITGLTVYLLASDHRDVGAVMGALAISGALAGFLRYNVPPARIFLGDSGAYAIGYVISVLAMAGYQRSSTAMLLVVPLLAAGLPMLDTLLAALRRLVWHVRHHGWSGLHPLRAVQAVTTADRGHIHHLLTRAGLDPRRALFVLYGISVALASLALMVRSAGPNIRWAVLICLLVIGFFAQRALQRRVEARERDHSEVVHPA